MYAYLQRFKRFLSELLLFASDIVLHSQLFAIACHSTLKPFKQTKRANTIQTQNPTQGSQPNTQASYCFFWFSFSEWVLPQLFFLPLNQPYDEGSPVRAIVGSRICYNETAANTLTCLMHIERQHWLWPPTTRPLKSNPSFCDQGLSISSRL